MELIQFLLVSDSVGFEFMFYGNTGVCSACALTADLRGVLKDVAIFHLGVTEYPEN